MTKPAVPLSLSLSDSAVGHPRHRHRRFRNMIPSIRRYHRRRHRHRRPPPPLGIERFRLRVGWRWKWWNRRERWRCLVLFHDNHVVANETSPKYWGKRTLSSIYDFPVFRANGVTVPALRRLIPTLVFFFTAICVSPFFFSLLFLLSLSPFFFSFLFLPFLLMYWKFSFLTRISF